MNAPPVDFTVAPAADVFPRKAPHPGERRKRKTGRGKYTRKKPDGPGSRAGDYQNEHAERQRQRQNRRL
ncbi:hypothetical protein PXU57_005490 [Salmonella enterica subsp. enterica]|nr:hypothetical protein [Salmonella enterica subsp. enterica]